MRSKHKSVSTLLEPKLFHCFYLYISFTKFLVALNKAGVLPNHFEDLLTAKAVEGPALSLEGVDDVHGRDCLPLCVLGVGDSVSDNVLQEDLQDSSSLLIDQT